MQGKSTMSRKWWKCNLKQDILTKNGEQILKRTEKGNKNNNETNENSKKVRYLTNPNISYKKKCVFCGFCGYVAIFIVIIP